MENLVEIHNSTQIIQKSHRHLLYRKNGNLYGCLLPRGQTSYKRMGVMFCSGAYIVLR